MRSTFVLRGDVLIDKATGEPAPSGPDFVPSAMLIGRDIAGYQSPVTKKWVEGRAAQREDLKRTGCRVADPSEFTPTYHSKERAIKHGREWEPRNDTAQQKAYREFATERAKLAPVKAG